MAADSFDAHCANIAILQSRDIQNEIGITASQRDQMNKFADANRVALQAYQKQLAGKPPEGKVLNGYLLQLQGRVVSVLSASQLKRLRELNLQLAGLGGLMDPVVAGKVGLNGAAYEKYKQTFLAGQKQANALIHQTMDPINSKYEKLASVYKGKEKEHEPELKKLFEQFKTEATAAKQRIEPAVKDLTRGTQQKLLAILTSPQKATWTALKGRTYIPPKGK